jgi:hypothetical protein
MTREPVASTRATRASSRARKLGAAAVATAGAVLVAVLAAGGTYALWDGTMQMETGTVSAGNTGLTINNVTNYAITGLDVSTLYPGRSAITATPLTVRNTGTTPLAVTPGTVTFANPSSPLASELVVAVRQAAVCTLTPYGSTPASFTSFTLQPNATATICVEVQLKSTAPSAVQGLSLGFTAPLVGTQVRP